MIKETGCKSPRVRFNGFVEAWKQKRLGEIYTERNERGNDSLQILSVSIHSGVSNGELDSETLGKQVRRSEDKSLYKHVYAGDLVLNMMRAWQGAIGVAASEGMVSPAYITAVPNESIYPPFMDFSLRRSQIVSQMNNLSYGVTDFRKRLYWDSFIRVAVHISSVAEQKKITDYLSSLDDVITLHQRKHDKLVALKQAMLQKMFPRDGATVPEIRFKAFKGKWVQAAFKEFAPRTTESCSSVALPRLEYEDIISGSGTLNKDVTKKVSVKSGIKFQIGDVLFGKLRPYLRNWLLADFAGIAVGDFWVLRSATAVPSFVYRLIQTMQFEVVANQSSGSKMPRADWQLVSNTLFLIPPDQAEQRLIGMYFLNLDKLVFRHAKQVEKLKNIKSACLEKMFV